MIQKINEILKGCGKNCCGKGTIGFSKELFICKTCQATLKATKETARLMIDKFEEELEFWYKTEMYDVFPAKDLDKLRQALQKQREELK